MHRQYFPSAVLRLVAFIVLACASAAVAQTQPRIRSAVVLVPLDVRVVDSNGDPVTDLTIGDFSVYENGVRQEIAHFVLLPFTKGKERRSALTEDEPLSAAASPHRTFVFLLGRGDLNGPVKGLDAVLGFIRRLEPTDRVGLVAYLRASEATTDHAAVLRFLQQYRDVHQDLEARIATDGRRQKGVLGTLTPDTKTRIDSLFTSPGIPTFRDLPGIASSFESRYKTWNYLRWTLQSVRRTPGEKHVIVIAQDALPLAGLEEKPADHIFVKWANEARVALSYVHTGGLTGMSTKNGQVRIARRPAGDSISSSSGILDSDFFAPSMHRILAEQTGGIATFYRAGTVGLDRLDRASGFQYLLGFYPTSTTSPDVPRAILVKINRANVTPHYRHAYRLSPSADDEEDFRAAVIGDRLDTELLRLAEQSSRTTLAGFRYATTLKLVPTFLTREGVSGELRVTVSFDPRRVAFGREGDSKRATLHLAVALDDSYGIQIAKFSRKVDVLLTEKDFERTNDRWLEFDLTLPVNGAPSRIRAAVYDYELDRLMSAFSRIAAR